jgi:hypothetical protein
LLSSHHKLLSVIGLSLRVFLNGRFERVWQGVLVC